MASLLRAIAAAVRSWFRSLGGRGARLEAARVAAEAEAQRKAEEEERTRLAAEAEARRQAEEAARVAAEAEARRKAEEEERARLAAEAEARRQAEEAARVAAEAESRRKAGEEERTRLAAEAEARRQAEEAARVAAEAEARRKAEEEERARLAAEADARRRAEEAARAAAEAEARQKAEEERARVAAEAEARRQAEEAARFAAEAEARRKAEEQERARLEAEAEARRQAEEAAGVAAEAEARRKAEEEERARDAVDADAGLPAEAAETEGTEPPAPGGQDAQLPRDEQEPSGEEAQGRVPAAKAGPRTRAPRYRAPAGGTPVPKQTSTAGLPVGVERDNSEPGVRHALPIELRLLFERGGSCRMSLLPRRTSGLPEELTLRTPAGTVDLVALQDDWYQDVVPDDLGALLRDGVVWRSEDASQEWLLSGRDVFVLALGTAHSGLVSCARLVIGREHAVVARVSRLPAVEAVLREARCEQWSSLDENDGVPRDWVVLRSVKPQAPVPCADTADILNVLRPLPQVEIALEGGICLGYASWLAGHPPAIRVYGDSDHTRDVRIDGQAASVSGDNCFIAPGWDSLGAHQVWCNGITRTYTLVRSEPPSRAWAAFSFPSPGGRRGGRLAICGPLVRAVIGPEADGEDAATSDVLQIPAANPVLLGPLPGQVLVTCPRPEIHGAQCLASCPFTPVWALPAQPLQCRKKENRVRLVGQLAEPGHRPVQPNEPPRPLDIDQWCRLIRDAGRKGLAVEPATPAVAELWTRYKQYARDLWRRRR